ncbi:hypothetical protein [Clostridium pasteurianum]|nr:hypothetical protein [Clostridium pasteurianum]
MKIKYSELFDINKIVNYLKPYSSYLNKSYIWNTPLEMELLDAVENKIFNEIQFNELISEENMFQRNVILKKMICKIILSTNSAETKKKIFKWIVNIHFGWLF